MNYLENHVVSEDSLILPIKTNKVLLDEVKENKMYKFMKKGINKNNI